MTRHFYESDDLLGDMLEENYFDHTKISMRTGDTLTVYSKTQNEYMDLRVDVDEEVNPDIATVTPMESLGRGNLVAVIGSSILAQGMVDTSSRFGYDVAGPVEWAMRRLGWRSPYINQAISGTTTSDMLERVNADVLSLRPHVVIVQNGTNEIGTGFAAIKETTQKLYMRILGSGAKLVVFGMAVRGSTGGWDEDEFKTMAAINEYKRRFCESHANCYYIDTNAYIADPSTGEALPDIFRDGIHWAPIGAYKVGTQIMHVLEDILPATDVLATYGVEPDGLSGFPYGNESPNAALIGTSGVTGSGVTGDVPDSWILERIGTHTATASSSIAAKSTDDPRNQVSISFTPSGGSGTDEFYFRINPSSMSVLHADTYYEGLIEVLAEAWEGFESITFEIDDIGSGNKTYYDGSNVYNLPMPNATWNGIFRTPEFVPTGNLRLRIRIGVNGLASGTGTVRFSSPVLRPIDPDTRLAFPRKESSF